MQRENNLQTSETDSKPEQPVQADNSIQEKNKLREAALAGYLIKAQQGDQKALQKFLEMLLPILQKWVARRLGADEAAREDIVQEVMIAVHQKHHTWRQDLPITPWLAAITRYKIVDHFRRQGRNRLLVPEELAESVGVEDPDPTLRRDARSLINRLDGRSKEALSAVVLGHLDHDQAAEQMGISRGNLRVSLHRGIQRLTRMVSQDETKNDEARDIRNQKDD